VRPGARNLCTPDRLHRIWKWLRICYLVSTLLARQMNTLHKVKTIIYYILLNEWYAPYHKNVSYKICLFVTVTPRRVFCAMCQCTYDNQIIVWKWQIDWTFMGSMGVMGKRYKRALTYKNPVVKLSLYSPGQATGSSRGWGSRKLQTIATWRC
jgi:hypothetical protein